MIYMTKTLLQAKATREPVATVETTCHWEVGSRTETLHFTGRGCMAQAMAVARQTASWEASDAVVVTMGSVVLTVA
jgi:hypothetical protein